ncbi:unnamed protein product [Effrenium voratum]|nr:unnamed protein product [Effrenium voratum]
MALFRTWLVVQAAWALQPKELEDWFASSNGLAMSREEAAHTASTSWNALAQCGVEVSTLQKLKDTLQDRNSLDLSLPEIKSQLLLLAEQHVNPDKLRQLYYALSGSYTLSGGLGLAKDAAQTMTRLLALKRAEPDQLKALYQVMYGYSGLGFDRALAQTQSIQLAQAGADAAQFKETYLATVQKGKQEALIEASKTAVAKDLEGAVRRYALDGSLYSAAEFQRYYGEGWLSAWLDSPMEKRISTDRRAYTANQFFRHFKSIAVFKNQPTATQQRLAEDGKVYDVAEFHSYFRDQWHDKWSVAPELACKECAPYGQKALIV